MTPHELGRSVSRFSSNESVFRGVGPQFWGAAQGNLPSANYAADVSIPSVSADNTRKFNNE